MGRRIVLTSVGSYGDLHPFIAVAQALRERGCDVVVATLEEYREKAETEGLTFVPVRPSLAEVAATSGMTPGEIVRRTMAGGAGFLVDTLIAPHLAATYEDLLAIGRGADLIVASSMSFAAFAAAEALKTPRATLLLSPMLLFSPQDPPRLQEAPWLEGVYRRLGPAGARAALATMRAGARLVQQPTRALRRSHGLPPVRGSEIMDAPLQAEAVIALYSPHFAPLPADAPPNAVAVGFTFYDSERGGAQPLDPALARFLDAGEPPLVFTLGSFAVEFPGAFYAESARAAALLGRRAVLLAGSQAPGLAALASPEVLVSGYAPHSQVFPRAAAVVHHGGVGTLAQALRAGRPQLVCPALGDQPDNAARLRRLGVARELPLRWYAAEPAAAALRELIESPDVATRCAQLRSLVAQEDGATAAAERLIRLAEGRSEGPHGEAPG